MRRRAIRALLLTCSVLVACHGSKNEPGASGNDPPIPPYVAPPDEPFRGARPTPGASRPFRSPEVERFLVPNHADVVLSERHTLPFVFWEIEFPSGAVTDPPGKEGRADLCTAVMVQGGSEDTAFQLAATGSMIQSSWDLETVTLHGFALRANLDPILNLWAQVLAQPGMRASDLERFRSRRLGTLEQDRTVPLGIADRVLSVAMRGPTHPYARLESAASLQAVSLADCLELYSAFLRPGGAHLYVSGDIDRAGVEQKFSARFFGTGDGRGLPEIPAGVPDSSPIVFSDAPGSTQAQVLLWAPGPSNRRAADYEAATVMASIFGGDSITSRLGSDLREMMGSAYAVSGSFSYTRVDSRLIIYAGVQTDKAGAAIQAILQAARVMRESDVTDEEIGRARDGRLLALPNQFATVYGTLLQFRDLVRYGLPLDYFDNFSIRLSAVDKASVRRAATDYLAPEQLRFVVVGDGRQLLPMLRAVAMGGELAAGEVKIVDADGRPVMR